MKRHLKTLGAILLITSLALMLFSCFDPTNDTQGTMTLVIMNGDDVREYSVDLGDIPKDSASDGLTAILKYLKEKGELTYESQNSPYGEYISQINDLIPQSNEFISFYTSVEKDADVGVHVKTIAYKGVDCVTSGLGASSMSVLADCVIIITKESY